MHVADMQSPNLGKGEADLRIVADGGAGVDLVLGISDRRTRKPPSPVLTQCESPAIHRVTFLHDVR